MSKILFSMLPKSLTISGENYPINPDFRIMAKLEDKLLKSDLGDKTKSAEVFTEAITEFYTERIPADIKEAFDGLWWFYRCGEDETDKGKNTAYQSKRLYDYKVDGARIISAFRSQYGIDLTTEKLHWWLFKAYFTDLDPECDFSRIMSYRCIDLNKIKNARERARYQRLQERYKLPAVKQTPLTKEERDRLYKERMMARVRGCAE